MQINSSKGPSTLYGTNQERLQTKTERTVQEPGAGRADKALTVAISPEAQALQKEAAAKRTEASRESDMQQQSQQELQAQRPAGKAAQRIDIAV